MDLSIYLSKGYQSRADYLNAVVEDYGVPRSYVYALADFLGPAEDFDGLVSLIQDYQGDSYE